MRGRTEAPRLLRTRCEADAAGGVGGLAEATSVRTSAASATSGGGGGGGGGPALFARLLGALPTVDDLIGAWSPVVDGRRSCETCLEEGDVAVTLFFLVWDGEVVVVVLFLFSLPCTAMTLSSFVFWFLLISSFAGVIASSFCWVMLLLDNSSMVIRLSSTDG